MNLRLGNQTAFAARSFLDPFDFALEHRFAAFEFFPDRGPAGHAGWDERGVSADERDYIRRAAGACGTRLTVHAPLEFNPLHHPRGPRLQSSIEFARDIGAVLLNVHLDARLGIEPFGRALMPAIEAARAAGLQLALENTVWNTPEEFNAFFRWLRESASGNADHVGACFDLGHANVCAATRNDYCGFLDRLDPCLPLIHLHLHENRGDCDNHLTLFTGPARESDAGVRGFLERLQRRGFDGCGIFEQWPDPASLLVQARDRLVGCLRLNEDSHTCGKHSESNAAVTPP